jgi:hypothetical protein
MKASELRIGNIFSDGFFIYKAINIHADGFIQALVIGNDGNIYPDSLYSITNHEGIPLTEEWLLRFGFTEDISNYTWDKLTGFDSVDYMFTIDTYPHRDGYFFHGLRLDYVHQLQNAFALTGNELTIS